MAVVSKAHEGFGARAVLFERGVSVGRGKKAFGRPPAMRVNLRSVSEVCKKRKARPTALNGASFRCVPSLCRQVHKCVLMSDVDLRRFPAQVKKRKKAGIMTERHVSCRIRRVQNTPTKQVVTCFNAFPLPWDDLKQILVKTLTHCK